MTKPPTAAGPTSSRIVRFVLIAGAIVVLVIPALAIASGPGNYGLADARLDFQGTARLDAKLSLAATGVKSFLLRQ
jgi:hypothetical protein